MKRLKQITNKFGKNPNPETEEQEIDPDQPIPVPNRREKRHFGERSTPKGTGEVHDILRRGRAHRSAKTGQPHWFRVMKFEAARRKSLEKVPLDRLEPAVGRVALDLFHAGYKNVWQVTQVESAKEFLQHGQHDNQDIAISGRDLKKLRAYLVQQRVPVKWEI